MSNDKPASPAGISTAQAAAILGVSTRWVRYLCERGLLDCHRYEGGNWIVDRESVERLANEREDEDDVSN